MNYLINNTTNFLQELIDGYMKVRMDCNTIIHHQHIVSEIAPCKGSSSFPLTKEVNNSMRGLINIQNVDNEYFKW